MHRNIKMFILLIITNLLHVHGYDLFAATQVIATDNAPFVFSEFSKPKILAVKSKMGVVQLKCFECTATQKHNNNPEAFSVNLVIHPNGKEVWIGEALQHFAVVEEKIWGISRLGGLLQSY